MDKDLRMVYKFFWDQLATSLKRYMDQSNTDMPTHPLLIYLFDEKAYSEAEIRVMFFGQETNDWEGVWGSKDIDDLIDMYIKFFGTGYCFKYGGHFWNAISDYVKSIRNRYPDKKVAFVWNNILKIGKAKDKGTPPRSIIDIEQMCFPVLQREIEILNPNVMIFFTGPYYDEYITEKLEIREYNQVDDWDVRKLARIDSGILPYNSFRTYHPGYLWRNNYDVYKEAILTKL